MASTMMTAIDTTPEAVTAQALGRQAWTSVRNGPGVVQSITKKPSTISAIPTIVYSTIADTPCPSTDQKSLSSAPNVVVIGFVSFRITAECGVAQKQRRCR